MRAQPARRHADAERAAGAERMRGTSIGRRAWWNSTASRSASDLRARRRDRRAPARPCRGRRGSRAPAARAIAGPGARSRACRRCCRMYAPCLWKPRCDTVKPTSCSSAAHPTCCATSGIGGRGGACGRARARVAATRSRVRAVDVVALEERSTVASRLSRCSRAAEQVVEHAQPQRAADRDDARELRAPPSPRP